MTLLTYQIFQAVVEEGSFQKAAKVLNLTPSAISHAISTVEKELGFPLFNRSKNGVTLTSYGENLNPYILSVLNSDSRLQQAISSLNGAACGSVNIGAPSSVCTRFIPDLITGFSRLYPDIEILLHQGNLDEIYRWLKTGVIDLGFLPESGSGDLEITQLYQEELVCITSTSFHPKHKSYIEPSEIIKQGLICQDDLWNNTDVLSLFQQHELKLHPTGHSTDTLSSIAMTAAGLGICIMPKPSITDIPYAVNLYPFKPSKYRTICICSQGTTLMTPAVKAMHLHITSYFNDKKKKEQL